MSIVLGACYYCAAGECHECGSTSCGCCGERNKKHEQDVAALVLVLKSYLKETGFYAKRNS